MSAVSTTTAPTDLPEVVVNDMGPLVHVVLIDRDPRNLIALCGHVCEGRVTDESRVCAECDRIAKCDRVRVNR